MIYRFLARVCFGISAVALAVGLIWYLDLFRTLWPRESVYVEQPEREFWEWDQVQDKKTVFRIHNPTRRTVRVVGLTYC
jgi:hypothetical protein